MAVKKEDEAPVDDKAPEDVDPANPVDETPDDASADDADKTPPTDDNEEIEDENPDDSEEQSSDEDEDDSRFKKRFTQFKGDSPEEYLPNLEEGYANSTREAMRLKQEKDTAVAQADEARASLQHIQSLIAKDPELAEKLEGIDVDGAVLSPELSYARGKMEQDMEAEFTDFYESHKDEMDDPDTADSLRKEANKFSKYVWATEKRQVGMKEALEFAANKLGMGSSDDPVRNAARNSAASSKPSAKRKPAPTKSKYSDAQIEWAGKIDPSLSGKSRQEIEAALDKAKR
jgi:hypothetical protein